MKPASLPCLSGENLQGVSLECQTHSGEKGARTTKDFSMMPCTKVYELRAQNKISSPTTVSPTHSASVVEEFQGLGAGEMAGSAVMSTYPENLSSNPSTHIR